MPPIDPRQIGRVRHVLGATVTVELDHDMAGVAPVWEGQLQAVGQLGSIVLIPQGPVTLLATVTLVGIAELSPPIQPASVPQVGDRWLQVQLLGEVTNPGDFRRGVSSYPGLDDPVLFATPTELRAIYPAPNENRIRIGHLAASRDIPVSLDAARLVVRHAAIVGSTGSGKSSAVTGIVQTFARDGWNAANIVVIDPHGEYEAALADHAEIRSVLGTGDGLLRVPFWALPALDLLTVLAGPVESATTRSTWVELVAAARRTFAADADWLDLSPEFIGADTPIPFNLSQVWHDLDYENNATFSAMQGGGMPEVVSAGDPRSLRRTTFVPYGLGSQAPFKGPRFSQHLTVPDRIRQRLSDPQTRFLQTPGPDDSMASDPLVPILEEWLGRDSPVSVLDFSGVSADITDIAVGLVIQLLFEVATRSDGDGVGRNRPILIVLEEAHRYLGSAATTRISRTAVDRVAREGRKYGVGILLVTQRPGELPETSLAQVGTILALRLTNSGDQSTIKAALPDAISGLADALPSLRTGEALVAGEAVVLPSRVVIDPPNPWPAAADPTLDSWRTSDKANDLARAVARWRGEKAT